MNQARRQQDKIDSKNIDTDTDPNIGIDIIGGSEVLVSAENGSYQL